MEAASDRVTPKEEALAYVHMVADASPGGSAEPSSAPPRDNALDQMKLFDMKKVQPPQFSGRPSDWQEFRFRLWILMEVVGIAAFMKMAEDRGTLGEVTVEEQHETVQARSRLLYLLLSQRLGGKALTILRGVHHANGLEAWRRLTLEYEPRIVARSTAMLTGILIPKWRDVAVGDFMEAILQWEKRVEDYDDVTGLPLGDAVKVAVVTQYVCPRAHQEVPPVVARGICRVHRVERSRARLSSASSQLRSLGGRSSTLSDGGRRGGARQRRRPRKR